VTCLYTSTANEDFHPGPARALRRLLALLGHGAKFAPLTGEIVADLACGGTSPERRFTLAAHLG
jgi:hypothetical protein